MRNTSSQLALGTGVHTCLGQMIARFETEAILNGLLKRAATLELAGKATHRLNNTARRLDHLPLKVTAK
jgi:cytochrome P450